MPTLHEQIMSTPYTCKTQIVSLVCHQIANYTFYARNEWSGEHMVRQLGGHDKVELYGIGGNPVVEYTLYHTSLVMVIGTKVYVNDSNDFSFSGSATTRNRRVCVPKRLLRDYSPVYSEILSYEQLPAAYG